MTVDQTPSSKLTTSALSYPTGLRNTLMELFDIGPVVAISALLLVSAIFVAGIVYFVQSAPPKSVTISSGPEGSQFYKTAQRYEKVLARNGVQAKVLVSRGSSENLERLNDPKSGVDIGIVQSGPASTASDRLESLGSISIQPVLIFYRGKPMKFLSELTGKRVSIGPVGSGARTIALALLKMNGIQEGEKTQLLAEDSLSASKLLEEKKIDAVFVMSESSSNEIVRTLLRHPDIQLYSFTQSDAYSRRLEYLNKLSFPEGMIDPGKNIPKQDVELVGPMIELIAVRGLHPALVNLMVEAATEVHSRPGFFHRRGDFPKAEEHAIQLNDDAVSFYKSGKSYLYRVLPFWLASLITRLLIAFVPVLVVLIPLVRSIPAFFRWITQLRIRRSYRELRILEQNYLGESDPAKKELLRQEFDRIEERVYKMKVRATFADQFYQLRGHIDYVRRVVNRKPEST